jgi:hypothetical protein
LADDRTFLDSVRDAIVLEGAGTEYKAYTIRAMASGLVMDKDSLYSMSYLTRQNWLARFVAERHAVDRPADMKK